MTAALNLSWHFQREVEVRLRLFKYYGQLPLRYSYV